MLETESLKSETPVPKPSTKSAKLQAVLSFEVSFQPDRRQRDLTVLCIEH